MVGICLKEGLRKRPARSACKNRSENGREAGKKSTYGAKRGQGSQRESEREQYRDRDVYHGERERLRGCFWVQRPSSTAAKWTLLWARRELNMRAGGISWDAARLQRRRDFIVGEQSPFARKGHGLFERESKRRSKRAGMKRTEIDLPEGRKAEKVEELCRR